MPYSSAFKSRKYCFTFFWNVEEYGDRGPGAGLFEHWDCEYLYVGLEICPSTQRPHYQGYVRFTNTRAKNGIMKLFKRPHKINCEAVNACNGTEAQNIKYCSKDEDLIIEWGTPEGKDDSKQPGKRNDIHIVRDMIKAGAGMRDVCMHATSYQSIRIAEVMLKYMEPPRTDKPEVYWTYGPTGTNKTRSAVAASGDPWMSLETSQWFEGYDGHYDMIIDDFRENWCSFVRLLRILDRYDNRLPCKGGSRQNVAKRIFITSSKPPHQAYSDFKGEDVLQLGRRITTIFYMPEPGIIYGAPGETIGVEPSVETLFPERSAERKVWGNTTEPYISLTEGEVEAPPLTRPQTEVTSDELDDELDQYLANIK